jgi:hypothetical protein
LGVFFGFTDLFFGNIVLASGEGTGSGVGILASGFTSEV